jgi:hypothetical protein
MNEKDKQKTKLMKKSHFSILCVSLAFLFASFAQAGENRSTEKKTIQLLLQLLLSKVGLLTRTRMKRWQV